MADPNNNGHVVSLRTYWVNEYRVNLELLNTLSFVFASAM